MLLPGLARAAVIGKVHALKGEAFMVQQGKTTVLTVGADIDDASDILVSDDAQITVGDFFDRRFHLGPGSTLTLRDRFVVLKKGALWTQSVGARSTGQVSTANMLITGEQGEWITTYDPASRRTQLTAISGEVRVASPQEPAFQYNVAAGFFTLADPQVDEGYPRSPTKLGYDSLMKALALFPGQKSRDQGLAKVQEAAEKQPSAPQRSIASVNEEMAAAAPVKKGEITFLSSGNSTRAPASADESGLAQSYFLKKSAKRAVRKKMTKVSVENNIAPVRVYGAQQVVRTAPRAPASVAPVAPAPRAQGQSQSVSRDEFLKSFEEHSKQQPKNAPEVQRLIDDLSSY